MSSLVETQFDNEPDAPEKIVGGEMSFLDHLEELRRRITRSVIFVFVAFLLCWFVSDYIYSFLSLPIRHALADAQVRPLPLGGVTGNEAIAPLSSLNEGDVTRYVFSEATKLGSSVIPLGASVAARVGKDSNGNIGLFTAEPLVTGAAVIPVGVRLPVDFNAKFDAMFGRDGKLIVTSVMESFSLYVKVSLYAAICLSIPFLLFQIWAFIAPGLYPHERGYAVPFIILSSVSFVLGAAFAYYVIFPPAAAYLLGLGQDFQLLLKATDYFDFIILVMLAMGVVFQMPAVTYILARIGIVTAGFLIRIWKTSLIVIMLAAALLSPTSDVLNMLLFAAPMLVLYVVSIFVAWVFGQERKVIN